MAYSSSGHLPFESASKTGHMALIRDPFVAAQLERFQAYQKQASDAAPVAPVAWQLPRSAAPFTDIVCCDGSYSVITVPASAMRVAYVRVGLHHTIPAALKSGQPIHPAAFAQDIRDNSDSLQAVIPLSGLSISAAAYSRLIRKTIFETYAHKPELLETIQWLLGRGWTGALQDTRAFRCPVCGKENIFPRAALHCSCSGCAEPLYLTDLIGFQNELIEQSAPDVLASCFMLMTEFFLLFTAIRFTFENRTPYTLDQTLFLKDGPLTLPSYYSPTVLVMRDFLLHAAGAGRPIFLCGAEKSGRFVSHLEKLLPACPTSCMRYFVPTNKYVQTVIDGRSLDAPHHYGERHLLGQKVFVVLPGGQYFVLSVPTTLTSYSFDQPTAGDMIGLDRILATIPQLLSYRYENALLPISLVNDFVSISLHPSGRMLELYSAKAIQTGGVAS